MPTPVQPVGNKYNQWAQNYVSNHNYIVTQFQYAAFALLAVSVPDGATQGLYRYNADPKIVYNDTSIDSLSAHDQQLAMAGLDAFFEYCLTQLYP
jgi:hypothetical protein